MTKEVLAARQHVVTDHHPAADHLLYVLIDERHLDIIQEKID